MEQKDSRFAVLIDADNVSPKYIKYILDEVSDQGVATYKRIYGDWTDISKKSWKEQLLRYSINPIQQYSNTNGKNSTDSAMIIDAMDILYSGNVEGFCLVSSDSDFTKLAQRLRESGMFVLGMGEQKTPSSFRVACDAFKILEIISQNEDDISPAITAVSENPARYGTSQDEPPSITSKAEIERTVSRVLTENNDHGKNTTLSEIGSILQKKFSEFDVRMALLVQHVVGDGVAGVDADLAGLDAQGVGAVVLDNQDLIALMVSSFPSLIFASLTT